MTGYRSNREHNYGPIGLFPTLAACPTPGKLAFASRSEAKKFLRRRKSQAGSSTLHSGLTVYRCLCTAFHFGDHQGNRAEALRISEVKLGTLRTGE